MENFNDLLDESGNYIILEKTDIGNLVITLSTAKDWIENDIKNKHTDKWRDEGRI